MNVEANLLKVAADSKPSLVAGAIAGMIREGKKPIVQVIGAGAVNQAIKALAVARNYLDEDGLDLVCIPAFVELIVDGRERTGIRLWVRGEQLPG